MQRLRVLHIINIAGIAGAEKMMLQLLPSMQVHADIACLICYPLSRPEGAAQIAAGLTKAGIKPVMYGYRKVYEKGVFRKIKALVTEGDFSLIHSHLKQSDFWLSILKLTGRVKIPVVSTMHSYTDHYANRFGMEVKKGTLYLSLYYWATRMIYSQLDGFILISNGLNEFFRKAGLLKGKPKVMVHHGYDVSILPELKYPAGGALRLALPGRLIKHKGHFYAIEAFAIVCKKNPDATMHFYGRGPDEQAMRSRIKELGLENRIIFEGFTDSILDELQRSHIILIPSLGEAFGLVFLDAFVAGIPVVAFDLSAGNEIVRHGYSGLLATPYSAASYADCILRLAEDTVQAKKMGENGRRDLIERFDIRIMTEHYIKFYQQTISNRG